MRSTAEPFFSQENRIRDYENYLQKKSKFELIKASEFSFKTDSNKSKDNPSLIIDIIKEIQIGNFQSDKIFGIGLTKYSQKNFGLSLKFESKNKDGRIEGSCYIGSNEIYKFTCMGTGSKAIKENICFNIWKSFFPKSFESLIKNAPIPEQMKQNINKQKKKEEYKQETFDFDKNHSLALYKKIIQNFELLSLKINKNFIFQKNRIEHFEKNLINNEIIEKRTISQYLCKSINEKAAKSLKINYNPEKDYIYRVKIIYGEDDNDCVFEILVKIQNKYFAKNFACLLMIHIYLPTIFKKLYDEHLENNQNNRDNISNSDKDNEDPFLKKVTEEIEKKEQIEEEIVEEDKNNQEVENADLNNFDKSILKERFYSLELTKDYLFETLRNTLKVKCKIEINEISYKNNGLNLDLEKWKTKYECQDVDPKFCLFSKEFRNKVSEILENSFKFSIISSEVTKGVYEESKLEVEVKVKPFIPNSQNIIKSKNLTSEKSKHFNKILEFEQNAIFKISLKINSEGLGINNKKLMQDESLNRICKNVGILILVSQINEAFAANIAMISINMIIFGDETIPVITNPYKNNQPIFVENSKKFTDAMVTHDLSSLNSEKDLIKSIQDIIQIEREYLIETNTKVVEEKLDIKTNKEMIKKIRTKILGNNNTFIDYNESEKTRKKLSEDIQNLVNKIPNFENLEFSNFFYKLGKKYHLDFNFEFFEGVAWVSMVDSFEMKFKNVSLVILSTNMDTNPSNKQLQFLKIKLTEFTALILIKLILLNNDDFNKYQNS